MGHLSFKEVLCLQTLRTALHGKDHRTFVAHGGDWYDRIRAYFRGDIVPARRLYELPNLAD